VPKKRRAAGEGTIRRRSDGRWEGILTLPDGRKRSVYGRAQREVKDKLEAIKATIQHELPVPDRRMTLADLLDRYERDVARVSLRPTTYRRYRFDLQRVRTHRIGRLPLSDVTPQVLQGFIGDLVSRGLSARSVEHCRAVVRVAFEWALQWGLVLRNPAKPVALPQVEKRVVEPMTEEMANDILDAVDGHSIEHLVTVALFTGLREGELIGLRWGHVNLDEGVIDVKSQLQRVDGAWHQQDPKSRTSRRRLRLPPDAWEALRRQRLRQAELRLATGPSWQDTGYVFTTRTGRPYHASNVYHQFQWLLVKAGLPRMRVHDLRHGTATMLLAKGVELAVIKEILGHASITITADLYAHVVDRLKDDAAAKLGTVRRRTRATP
jgi:integrase